MPSPKRQWKPESLDQAFRAELRYLREQKGLTQTDLSAKSGYGQNYISNIETGKQDPTISVLFDLLQTLDKRPDQFMKNVVARTQPKKPRKKRSAKP